ncbi:DUF6265 family protein [Phenylobacterium sp.]|jgi:hypothetical protein|uniref:DUF6265 family protein n=1 Tax=Phenylobacterium sp. TaxID=1871053 RepID=UPI002F428B64
MILAALAAATALTTAKAEVAKLTWMAGVWTGQSGGTTVQLTWLPPLDGAMAAVNQAAVPGKAVRVEFITITADDEGVAFTPVMAAAKLGVYRKQPGPDGEAVFENPQNAFPRRVIYRRCGADLCTRLEGEMNGKPTASEIHYIRLTP